MLNSEQNKEPTEASEQATVTGCVYQSGSRAPHSFCQTDCATDLATSDTSNVGFTTLIVQW